MELASTNEGATESYSESEAIAMTTGRESRLSRPVRSAIRHMALRYSDPITLGDLSFVTKLSPYQIIRAFRRELGITPHAWLIRHRVRIGTSLLKKGESIATVASEVGFVDQTHFTRHFKRLHGKTPARFLNAGRTPEIHSLPSGSVSSALFPRCVNLGSRSA